MANPEYPSNCVICANASSENQHENIFSNLKITSFERNIIFQVVSILGFLVISQHFLIVPRVTGFGGFFEEYVGVRLPS